MPTYTYKCPIHGEFEVEQRISDPKLQTCPQAVGRSELERGHRLRKLGACAGESLSHRVLLQPEHGARVRRATQKFSDVIYGGGFRIYSCGSPVERLISPGTSFVLKGQGWAKDGYK